MNTICVIGLGYIGLPTACMFATHGNKVIGVDINQAIVNILRNGDVHIEEPGLKTIVQEAIVSGNFQVESSIQTADVFIIAVPTQYVLSATEAILPHLKKGNLVVLESTSPPRTTIDLVAPILERSGLRTGEDYLLVYSPERVLPGQILRELVNNARVIGGVNDASAIAGRNLYKSFVKGEIILTDTTTAEMVKLMENTFRDVNIAIANEFSRMADRFGINVWEAIAIANRHPRVNILRPGPGVGGHCISVDPWFLVEAAPDLAGLIRQARMVNDSQPGYVVSRLEEEIGPLPGKKIAVLGLTYKANVDDIRESPAIEVIRILIDHGAAVRAFDPHIKQNIPGLDGIMVKNIEEAVSGVDGIMLLVDHAEFESFEIEALSGLVNDRLIFDACGLFSRDKWEYSGSNIIVLGNRKIFTI
jgi:UDP-N-acetyl-D-mannosaminuronic acid dehydrogenase